MNFDAFASRHPLLARILLYGASRGATEALIAFRGILLATLLGPAAFGGWALFRISCRYASLASIGLARGLEFEVVRARRPGGAGDGEASAYESAALTYVVIVFSIIGAVVLAGSWWVTNTALQAGMRAFAFGVLAEQIWVHVAAATRARGKFRRFALNEVLNGVLHVAVAWMLAAAFGLNGAYFGFVLVTAIAGGLLLHSAPIRLAWSTPRLKQLLRVGVPMLALLTAALVLGTVDRLVVAAYRGTEQLGVYAFAVAVGSLANTLALIVRTVIFPSVYAGASDAGAGRAVEAHLRRALRPFALFVPPLLGVAAIALGPVIVMLVPQYADAAVPARFFVFTGVATGLVTLTTIAAVATERQALLPAYAVVGVVLNIALSVMALEAGLGLPAVALAALLSQSTYAGLVLFVMARAGGHATPARAAASVLMPVLWCVVAMVITQRLFPMLTVGSALRGLAVFALLISPLAPSVLKTLRERLSAGPARG